MAYRAAHVVVTLVLALLYLWFLLKKENYSQNTAYSSGMPQYFWFPLYMV